MEASSLTVYSVPQTPQHTHFNVSVLIEPELKPDTPNDTTLLLDEHRVSGAIAQNTASPASGAPLQSSGTETNAQFWKVFGSTFITIFLAELGDKTQVATLLMSAESHAPWSVFVGAAIALITTSLLGVLVGQWLSSRVSPKTLDTAAGIMLALLSIWLLWDVVKM